MDKLFEVEEGLFQVVRPCTDNGCEVKTDSDEMMLGVTVDVLSVGSNPTASAFVLGGLYGNRKQN